VAEGGGLSRWEVAGAIAGLGGYVYVLGGVVSWARFSAAGIPADQAVSLLADREMFALGLRSLVFVIAITGALFAVAYLAGLPQSKHARAWSALPTVKAIDDREDTAFVRLAAGFNALLISGVAALAAGAACSRLPGSGGVNDAIVVAAAGIVGGSCFATFLRLGPWLLQGWRRWATLAAVAVIALLSELPIALLIATGALVILLGRAVPEKAQRRTADDKLRPLAELLRTRLPLLLAALYALVGFAYESLPPVAYPRVQVTTAHGNVIGGYVGRTDEGAYVITCRSDQQGHSTEALLTLVPGDTITGQRLGGGAFRVDSGARPSPVTYVADALDLTTRDITLISPQFPGDPTTCAADVKGEDTTGLGSDVLTDPHGTERVRVPSTEPTIRDDHTPDVVADLLRRYQPTVETTVEDRFWPVAVSTVLQESGRNGRQTCLKAGPATCEPGVRLEQLDASGAADDYFDLPEALASDPNAQFEAFVRGQGFDATTALKTLESAPETLDPWGSAQIYAYFAGKLAAPVPSYYPAEVKPGMYALQYWFYYPYNYLPLDVDRHLIDSRPLAAVAKGGSADQHEGDWEGVTVLLDETLQPRLLFMARHDNEGVAVRWDRLNLDKPDHPIVQAAFGGHPTYPNKCGAFPRAKTKNQLIDFVSCGSKRFVFRAQSTALANLARAPWACWPGHFGEATEQELANGRLQKSDPRRQIKVAGPRSPLRQGPNKGVCGPARDRTAPESAFAASHQPAANPVPATKPP
jgi:hypothetical protein